MTTLAIGSFARADPFRAAIRAARAADRVIVGLWSPVPVDTSGGTEKGARGIAATMAIAGCAGAASFYLFIWWSAAQAYAFNSGGRSFNSWPAFLIAPVEFGALIAGIAGLAAFFLRARLTNLHDAAFEIEEVGAAMRDRFVIAIRCDAGPDANTVLAMLGDTGATDCRVIEQ